MVKHIVAWNWAEHLIEEERLQSGQIMKRELENLINLIPGIISIKLYTKPLASSDFDLLLDSVFESEEALMAYQVHPEHVRVGSNYVKPVVCNRKCIDIMMD